MRTSVLRSMAALAILLTAAGPAAAVSPTISPVPLDSSYPSYCGDVEVTAFVTFTMVTEMTYYDQDGNVTRYMVRGPITYRLVAPNGNSITMSSNAMYIYDATTGTETWNGQQLWFDNVLTLGRVGSVGFFGTSKDLCAELGYSA